MKHIVNLFLLFLAFLSGIFGILLFKSIYNDFSLADISFLFDIAVPLLGSAFFVALGIFIGFYAFKKMKGS